MFWKYKNPPYTAWHYKEWYCRLMNKFNPSYWFCDCEYVAPFGLVIEAGCKRHD